MTGSFLRVVCLFLVVAAAAASAQDRATSAEEVQAAVDAPLRGHETGSTLPLQSALKTALPPAMPSLGRGVTSAARLRHKIPKQAEKAYTRGVKISKSGKYLEASHAFELAITQDPDYADAHNDLGAQYIRLNRLSEAQRELLRAIELDSAFAAAFVNLGWVELQVNNLTAAEQHARRAIALSARNDEARSLLDSILSLAKH